jgi:N-acetylglutamate synthase-like GNAT family acetyltransferase
MGADVRPEVGRFYKSVGYTGGIQDTDIVFMERQGQDVAGVTRLCKEGDVLVLRGMTVTETLRGTGIGTRLLRAASEEIGSRECWCIPNTYLSDFYSVAGFSNATISEAPAFLAERHRRYIEKGMDVVLMKRSKSFYDGNNHDLKK